MPLQSGAKLLLEVKNEGLSESAEVRNDGTVEQPLTGWALVSLHGTEVFRFPDGLVLGRGRVVTITSGDGVRHEPPDVHGWTDEQVWNNRGDMALLFDHEGEEVARYAYRRTSRGARVPRQVLRRDEDGTYRLEPVRREPPRNRLKPSRRGGRA